MLNKEYVQGELIMYYRLLDSTPSGLRNWNKRRKIKSQIRYFENWMKGYGDL